MTTSPHDVFLRRAIELSREHSLKGAGGPFGAVIVEGDRIVAEGWNLVTSTSDPTAHAEVVAIRRAAAARGDHSLHGCVIYSSCEPCPMCFGAIHWARLGALYFAATRDDAASIEFDDALLYEEVMRPVNERTMKTEQALRTEAQAAMREWHTWSSHTQY
jgi:guanine deaminase